MRCTLKTFYPRKKLELRCCVVSQAINDVGRSMCAKCAALDMKFANKVVLYIWDGMNREHSLLYT